MEKDTHMDDLVESSVGRSCRKEKHSSKSPDSENGEPLYTVCDPCGKYPLIEVTALSLQVCLVSNVSLLRVKCFLLCPYLVHVGSNVFNRFKKKSIYLKNVGVACR